MIVSVPASSANLGPGFDCLGMALNLPFRLADEPFEDALVADDRHPASVAFVQAGGSGDLWWRSPIPPGRGLGFSGAARVAGALLGCLQSGQNEEEARREALEIAVELEQHPDNAAASMLGGITVAVNTTPTSVVRIPTPLDLSVVVWWPESATSTKKSRSSLPQDVPMADAVYNIGRAALLVAALAAGDREALGEAMTDRLHQSRRFAFAPDSAATHDLLVNHRLTIAAWLSGSGPTVAAFVDPSDAESLVSALPLVGNARVLDIDGRGARIERE